MCGSVAYPEKKVAHPILIEGLKRLKHPGYDSSGVALLDNGGIRVQKSVGANQKHSSGQHEFEWTVQQAIQKLHGTCGFAILCSDFPDVLIGAKKGSPLILGMSSDEYILASDAAAIVEHTTRAIYLAKNVMVE